MALRLAGRWVWDFWLARDRGLWHVFFLTAPQTPDDPDARHFQARVGHAMSPDLRSWEELPDALRPAGEEAWDDLATWTGSVIQSPRGGWAMLYTGVGSREQGLVQRIGLARSDDLCRWVRHDDNPILEADPRWYELLDTEIWFDQAWRDPWVVADPDTGLFHAFVTARCRRGDPAERGVIGHAVSLDLVEWEIRPPIVAPRGFGYMEVPQVFHLEGHWHLLFSAPAWAQATRPGPHCTGTFHAISDRIEGPYAESSPLFSDLAESRYGGKIVKTPTGPVCLAFRDKAGDGSFVGEIIDPIPVEVARNGAMVLLESRPSL